MREYAFAKQSLTIGGHPMKSMKRAVSLLLIAACLLSCLAVVSGGAAGGGGSGSPASQNTAGTGSEVRYTKKIVSVLFDNSGSMDNKIDCRNDYALYSIQMLMSLLSERDELIITPMNVGGSVINAGNYKSASFVVNLAAEDRDAEVKRVMSQSFLAGNPNGGTPEGSMDYAVKNLTDRGLKDSQNLAASAANTEHWFVILTDGEFNGQGGSVTADNLVEQRIKDYPSLKTVFIAFGSSAPDLSGSYLTQTYPFTAYQARESSSVINAMQSVANQLCGRYVLDDGKFTVNGSSVTVDLGKLDFSLKSISVVAQNCGATLKSATYNGANMTLSQACVISPNSVLKGEGMKDGYSAVVNGDPFFSGGTITFNFSSPVEAKNLSIMAEPALTVQAYVERQDGGNWVRTNEQYINANLIQGDKLRIGYEVFEQATGKVIDVGKIFSDVKTSVTYAKQSYNMGDEITLVTGNNEIAVEVSVMNGAYKMYSTIRCIIEVNPSDYRIEATTTDKIDYYTKKAVASYVVYSGGVPLSKNDLTSNFTYTVQLTSPNGSVTELTPTVQSNGQINAEIVPEATSYGTYSVVFRVYNKFHISREHAYTLEYKAPEITVSSSGTDNVTAGSLRGQVTFEVLADGVRVPKNVLESYFKLGYSFTQPDGNEDSFTHKIMSDGTISCDITVDRDMYGKAFVDLSVTDDYGLDVSHSHTIGYYPTAFEIKGEHVDKLPSGQTSTEMKYVCYVDGKPMPKSELDKYSWSLTATEYDGNVFAVPAAVESDGSIAAVFDLSQRIFGVYDINLSVSFSDDYVKTYDHSVSYYPESLLLTAQGGMSLSEHQLTINEQGMVFELLLDSRPSSFLNKIITYKLTVGGVDVTEFATNEDNRLIYVPKAEHLGSMASVGDKTVTLAISCAEVPSLSTSQSVTLSVTPTIFEVVPLDVGNKVVDRFDLANVDAALYFKVLRDGIPLNCEELEEALASGKLSLKDKKGTFTWQFWIPTGRTVAIEEIDGTPVVSFRVERDIPLVGTFLAMLIFNGDKNVVTSYGDVSGTDAINFKSSAAWSYIWRILVILWFIHTVLYVVGFFNRKCRRLPKGTLVTISVSGSDSKELKPSVRPINSTFMERNGWHIVRYFKSLLFFLPGHKYWYHQPAASASGVTVLRTAKGTEQLSFSKTNIYPLRYQGGSESAQSLAAYKQKLRNYKGYPPNKFQSPVIAGDVRDMFVQVFENGAIKKDTCVPLAGKYYGRFAKEKLTAVIFFEKNISK